MATTTAGRSTRRRAWWRARAGERCLLRGRSWTRSPGSTASPSDVGASADTESGAPGGEADTRVGAPGDEPPPQRPEHAEQGNVQAWAREVRYGAAQRIAEERDALIATGHTASDQVETILY